MCHHPNSHTHRPWTHVKNTATYDTNSQVQRHKILGATSSSKKFKSLRQAVTCFVFFDMCVCVYIYIYIGFKTFFYVLRHLDSIASSLPTGLHFGFFRSWPSLFLPPSFSSVFLVLSFVSASNSMLFCHSLNMAIARELVLFNLFYNLLRHARTFFFKVRCGENGSVRFGGSNTTNASHTLDMCLCSFTYVWGKPSRNYTKTCPKNEYVSTEHVTQAVSEDQMSSSVFSTNLH